METDVGAMRRSCHFEVEKNLRHQFEVPRDNIITERKGFVIKTTTAAQYSRLMKAERVGNMQCTVSTDNPILRSCNSKRGIVYLSDYNVRDIIMLEEGFKKRHNISEVILAHWIKTRNKKSTAIQITFAQCVVLITIYTGEKATKSVPTYGTAIALCQLL